MIGERACAKSRCTKLEDRVSLAAHDSPPAKFQLALSRLAKGVSVETVETPLDPPLLKSGRNAAKSRHYGIGSLKSVAIMGICLAESL